MTTESAALAELKNDGWVRQAFFLPVRGKFFSKQSLIKRSQEYTEGSLSFADTTLGGNKSINPRPGFTEVADPNVSQLLATTKNQSSNNPVGMGRYYHEAIDVNAQRIYMQFGVPAYNSLASFFTTFYDSDHGRIANSGAVGSLFYTIGKIVGFVTLWPVAAVLGFSNFVYKAYKDVKREPTGKYYYMKPTMSLYWTTVTTIVNAISVNMGLTQGADAQAVNNSAAKAQDKLNTRDVKQEIFGLSKADAKALGNMLPDIYQSEGGIDVKAVATRYQRLAHQQFISLRDLYDKAYDDGIDDETLEKRIQEWINERGELAAKANLHAKSLSQTLDEYSKTGSAKNDVKDRDAEGKDILVSNKDILKQDISTTDEAGEEDQNVSLARKGNAYSTINQLESGIANPLVAQFDNSWDNYMKGELQDGSMFISYIVDWSKEVTESFSSSTQSSAVADAMNQKSASARSAIFNMAGGNLGDGVIAGSIEAVTGALTNLVKGSLDVVGLGALGAIAGSAFVDIPDFWENSSTSFDSTSYTIQLRSPYGSPLSILQNVIVPLATLIAAAAPRSTGKNSYTSPFLCKLWSKGRAQIDLGIIDSLTITRGTGNVGWNTMGQAMGVDVTFNVLNLSKLLHVPITNEIGMADILGITMFDEDNAFTNYMAVLGSLGLAEQYYNSSRWRLRRARSAAKVNSWWSVSNFWSSTVDTGPGSIISGLARKGEIEY